MSSDTNFPTSKDDATSLPNPAATDTTKEVPHAELHNAENKAIIAVETKLGTGSSTPAANKVLMGDGNGSSSWTDAVPESSIDGLTDDLAAKANSADLADVATSGSYNDLSDTPDIPDTFDDLADGTTNKAFTNTLKTKLDGIASGAEVNVQGDWSETDDTADDYIKNKPNLADVATSGSYNDLSDTPVIDDLLPDQTGKSDYVLTSDGSSAGWEPPSGGSGSGANLTATLTDDSVQINSDTGTDALIQSADDTNAGILTSADKQKLDGIASGAEVNDVTSVNTQTGAVVLDADDISDDSTTNKYTTASDISKLAGVEAGADVTDAENVAAAGATMNTDTDVSDNSYVLDEDDMASDSDTKVPTQQSVKAYVDNSSISPPNKYVEAMPLHHIGHSYTQIPYEYSPNTYNTEYGLRIRERLHMGDYHWHGRGGTFAEAMIGRLLSPTYDSGTGLWTEDTKGVVIIENYTNELGSTMSSDSDFNNLWADSIRGEIAVASSESILAWGDKASTSGTWSQYNASGAEKGINGTTYYAASGGSVSFIIPQGDEAWVATVVSKSTYSIADLQFKVGSTEVGTYSGNGLRPSFTDPITDGDDNTTVILVKVTGLNAAAGTTGSKTLTINVTGTGNGFVSGVVIPSATPPRVFVAKEPPRGDPPESQWTSAHAWYDSEIETIVGEFDNAVLVDLQTDFDSTMYVDSATDGQGIHPNDKGQSFIADKFVEAINTNITDWDAGVQSL